jgi:alginate O-acetyltransferase complex protein AlgJ
MGDAGRVVQENLEKAATNAVSGKGRAAALLLTAGLLAMAAGVPLLDLLAELRRERAAGEARWPLAAALAEAFGSAASRSGARTAGARLESTLEARSTVGAWALAKGQGMLVGALGAGTDRVLRGRDGWLFFRPAVESLTGRGFLAAAAAGGRRSDPRPAALQFARHLADRGIRLVVVPAPAKATIYPEMLAAGAGALAPLRNPSFEPFMAEMRAAGVLVFDPAPVLLEEKARGGEPLYLATDTHWRPRAVELVAARLAEFLREEVELDDVDDPGYLVEDAEVLHHGDLAAMLRLPAGQEVFPPERVAVRQVVTADDLLWRLDRSADVLLLGDSFANIYSLAGLGWGEGAGLAEHLSYQLGRPLDAMTRNDDAAYATRLMLAQELSRGRDRLAGKRVVVWELAERELALGDWREIQLELAAALPRRLWAPARGTSVVVSGTILEMGVVPRPRGAPYADHVAAVHLGDLESRTADVAGREAVVFVRTMIDYALTPEAAWRPGQRVTLRLAPWADVGEEIQSMMRSELTDPELLFAEPSWGEVVR